MDYILNVTGFILEGAKVTGQLYILTAVFSVLLGILCALAKSSRFRLLRMIIGFYTWVFRGTPLLLQLFFTYYGLPTLGITLEPFQAAAITFIINLQPISQRFSGLVLNLLVGQYGSPGTGFKLSADHV